jgi:L-amino acid N-acyltransferase YncA
MSGNGFDIRPSRDEDIAAITAIYGYHVRHGVGSFEEVSPSAEEIGRRRGEIVARGLPYLVAERGGRVVGYCYAGPFRPRTGYRFTLEDSIYGKRSFCTVAIGA